MQNSTGRGVRGLAALITLIVGSAALAQQQSQPTTTSNGEASSMLVYLGTYSGPKSKGIYVTRFDPAAGTLSPPQLAAEASRASFVAIHPNKRWLYAVDEIKDASGNPIGAVAAFAIDRDSGKLPRLNDQPSAGKGPPFVAVDATGKNVLVANYGSGSVAVLPIDDDGKLRPPTWSDQHHGSGPDKDRQAGPHAHSFFLSPDNRFAFAPDLGLDKVFIYRFDAEHHSAEPNDPPFASVPPGAGCRHLAFSKDGRFVYVINEMGGSVTVFSYDASRGAMQQIETISTLPPDYTGPKRAAEVRVHPNGKFLYASNRGDDSIAVFSIDAESGKLTPRSYPKSGGTWPRNFTIDPTGRYVIAANEKSDNVVVLRIDPASGDLTPTGSQIQVGSPTCVRFVE